MLFTKTEYKERLIKVQTEMQKKGIDLLVSSDPANMNYLSGYDAHSFYMPQCLLIQFLRQILCTLPNSLKIRHL